MRIWVPEVGSLVKLRTFADYGNLCVDEDGVTPPSMWSDMKVLFVGDHDGCPYWIIVEAHNYRGEPKKLWHGRIGLEKIQPPLGWEPVYTIQCKDKETALKVVSNWFKRGIHVWTSHDLSCPGGNAFTPFEADGDPKSPHWRYTGNPVESVPADQCEKVFNVKYTVEGSLDLPSGYPGDGSTEYLKLRRQEVAKKRKEGWHVDWLNRCGCYEVWREEILFLVTP